MKKVKTLLAVLLASSLALTLVACSDSSSAANQTSVSQEDKVSENTDEVPGANDVNASGDILPEFDKTGTIDETYLTDVFGVSITATKLSYTGYSVELSLLLENKSDANREVYAGTAGYPCNSVNGYMIHDGYMRCELEPDAVEEDKISFSYEELYFNGISKIADIGIGFDVSDDDYNHEKSEMIFIKTKNSDSYDYAEDTYLNTIKGSALKNAYGITTDALSEDTIYSEAGVSLISQAILTNKDGDSKLMLEFENKSDRTLNVRLSDLKVNGQAVGSSFLNLDMIWQDKKNVLSVSLDDYFKENEELTADDIKSAELNITLSDSDYIDVTQKAAVTIDFN